MIEFVKYELFLQCSSPARKHIQSIYLREQHHFKIINNNKLTPAYNAQNELISFHLHYLLKTMPDAFRRFCVKFIIMRQGQRHEPQVYLSMIRNTPGSGFGGAQLIASCCGFFMGSSLKILVRLDFKVFYWTFVSDIKNSTNTLTLSYGLNLIKLGSKYNNCYYQQSKLINILSSRCRHILSIENSVLLCHLSGPRPLFSSDPCPWPCTDQRSA